MVLYNKYRAIKRIYQVEDNVRKKKFIVRNEYFLRDLVTVYIYIYIYI